MKTIDIVVSPQGEVKVEANGFTDGTCFAATKEIEAAIGKVTKDEKKEGISGETNKPTLLQ